ncbi:hypothetical protein SLI_8101 [Streptomyces lividans 1326]|uniref:Uncharacterized protein n=1 Tax=Streptomyces lividans 1326 TaxID=1200984 RepID=A0A7U9DZ30_STRLI|nr:hypothetical protein SLI_8101 [Streptomyces lividans 1326]
MWGPAAGRATGHDRRQPRQARTARDLTAREGISYTAARRPPPPRGRGGRRRPGAAVISGVERATGM